MRKFLTLYFFLFTGFLVTSQTFRVSEATEISILTVGPGDNLYDKFGHSAFRIKDEPRMVDIVYNYGVYDFDEPNFYGKFAQGKLNYKVIGEYFEPFLERYVEQDRWVNEQVLDLDIAEKQALFDFLQNNARPENQYYLYDFFYDNCATKIRDVLVTVLGESLEYSDTFVKEKYTFRQLIQKNVQANSWGSLGMDLGIGAVVDVKATPWEYQFLPEYVFEASAVAKLKRNDGDIPLVKETRSIFTNKGERKKSNFFLSPLFIFGLLSLFIIYTTIKDVRRNDRSRKLDAFLFGITGLIGTLLLLLWFATDHSSTANNYNLLWAFPVSLIFAFTAAKRRPSPRLRKYIFLLLLLLVLLCIHWVTGVQVFAIGFIPLFIALTIRYIYLIWYLKRETAEVTDP